MGASKKSISYYLVKSKLNYQVKKFVLTGRASKEACKEVSLDMIINKRVQVLSDLETNEKLEKRKNPAKKGIL